MRPSHDMTYASHGRAWSNLGMMLTIADPLLCLAGHHHLGGRPEHAIVAIAGAVACDVDVAAWGWESRDSNGIGLQRWFASAMCACCTAIGCASNCGGMIRSAVVKSGRGT
jgi:hypothetical protein